MLWSPYEAQAVVHRSRLHAAEACATIGGGPPRRSKDYLHIRMAAVSPALGIQSALHAGQSSEQEANMLIANAAR